MCTSIILGTVSRRQNQLWCRKPYYTQPLPIVHQCQKNEFFFLSSFFHGSFETFIATFEILMINCHNLLFSLAKSVTLCDLPRDIFGQKDLCYKFKDSFVIPKPHIWKRMRQNLPPRFSNVLKSCV